MEYIIVSKLDKEKFQEKLFELGFSWRDGRQIYGSVRGKIMVNLALMRMYSTTKGHEEITLGQLRKRME